jgi:hypothetical protein
MAPHHRTEIPGQPQPPCALLRPRGVADSDHGARVERAAKEDGSLDKGDPPVSLTRSPLSFPLPPSLTGGPLAPRVGAARSIKTSPSARCRRLVGPARKCASASRPRPSR